MYSSVRVEARKYLLLDILSSNLYSPTQIKDRLLSNQTQTIRHEVVGLTIAFYLVYATYESNFWEYLGMFVVESIADIRIPPSLKKFLDWTFTTGIEIGRAHV